MLLAGVAVVIVATVALARGEAATMVADVGTDSGDAIDAPESSVAACGELGTPPMA